MENNHLLFSSNSPLQISITRSIKKREKKFSLLSYIDYIIDLNLNKKSWNVCRRYSEFYKLNQALSKKIKNLPKFPPKNFIFTELQKMERQKKLENYLIELLFRSDIYQLDEFFLFLELEKEYYLLSKNFERGSIISEAFSTCDTYFPCDKLILSFIDVHPCSEVIILEDFYYSSPNHKITGRDGNHPVTPCDPKNQIDILLDDLCNNKQNISSIIKDFENAYNKFFNNSSSSGTFHKADIHKLFFGEPTIKNLSRGLLYHIGTLDENHIGAVACLNFVSNLIDCERNIESEVYKNILRMGKVKTYEDMRLYNHMKTGNDFVVQHCFAIVRCICMDRAQLIQVLFKNDEKLISIYNSWLCE